MTPGTKGANRRFCCGFEPVSDKRAHGAAVEGAEEADDVLASGVIAGELHSALHGLGAGVAVVEPMRAGHRGNGGQPLRQLGHVLVVEIGAGYMNEFGGLILNRLNDLRMTVTCGVDSDAGGEIEELVAVDVGDANATAGLCHHGIAARVAGGDQALIVGNNLLRVRTGERGLQLGAELGVVCAYGNSSGWFPGSGCSCDLSL